MKIYRLKYIQVYFRINIIKDLGSLSYVFLCYREMCLNRCSRKTKKVHFEKDFSTFTQYKN